MSASLLALLQLSDSGFPSGSFTHSYGLEQALNERLVSGVEELEAFVRSIVLQSTATADARAAFAACDAASKDDIPSILEADQALYRTKAAFELRQACVSTGRRLIEETVIHLDAPVLSAYAEHISSGASPGCYPVAFGVVSGAMSVEPHESASALLIGTANALLQAAMRLGRISHRDAQAILHCLRPSIAGLDLSGSAIRAFHPLQEIASMRHRRAEARLFAS